MIAVSQPQASTVFAVSALALLAAACGTVAAEPELTVVKPERSARPNRPYRVVYEVSWQGEAADYVVLPAQVAAPAAQNGDEAEEEADWATMSLAQAEGTVDGDTQRVSQVLEIVPHKTGEFTIPEIEIAYLDPEAIPLAENTAQLATLPGSSAPPSLRAKPFPLIVRPSAPPVWLFAGLGVLLVLGVAGWWLVHRMGRRRPAPVESAGDLAGIQNVLHGARRQRLDGKYYEFYVELARAAEMMDTKDREPGLLSALKERAQDAGFRGVRPTDDQMDGDWGDVERVFAHYAEEPKEERQS